MFFSALKKRKPWRKWSPAEAPDLQRLRGWGEDNQDGVETGPQEQDLALVTQESGDSTEECATVRTRWAGQREASSVCAKPDVGRQLRHLEILVTCRRKMCSFSTDCPKRAEGKRPLPTAGFREGQDIPVLPELPAQGDWLDKHIQLAK